MDAGVLVSSGTGDSILSNSVYSNGQSGILLTGSGNHAQTAPVLTAASGGGSGSNVEGSLTSVLDTTFLIQFFNSPIADPSGIGQGQTFLGSTTVTTSGSGTAAINFNLTTNLLVGSWVTVTATNQSTGDTSEFSNAVSTQPVSVSFSMVGYTVASTAGSVLIDVVRTGNLNVAVSVNYATSNGSAVAGQDYTAVAGTLTFPPTATDETFLIPILSNPNRSTSFSTVNLALSDPVGGATLGTISSSTLTITNSNLTVKTFVVNNTGDSGLGTLLVRRFSMPTPTTAQVFDNIVFDIPASTARELERTGRRGSIRPHRPGRSA